MLRISRIPGYIGAGDLQLFSWIHTCANVPSADFGVVICPPLGIDYMNSHRALRHTADEYARNGVPAMRIDYLGCGDSADLNPELNQLDIQIESLQLAIKSFKQEMGLRSIGLFGFKFGATLAALVSQQCEVEFMVLWAPVVKGKRYLREIKLLQQVNQSPATDENLEARGLVINPETESAWKAIDLSIIIPGCNRILVVPPDEVASQAELCAAWESDSCVVTELVLHGSSDMLLDAHFAKVPVDSIVQIAQWSALGSAKKSELSSATRRCNSARLASFPECGQTGLKTIIKESIDCHTLSNGFLVVTEPENPVPELPMIVLLNSGANHHVGPHRIYVSLSRRLAKLGFTCARVDLPGLGDGYIDDIAQENITYLPSLSAHIARVLTALAGNKHERKFVIAGLCSGAYGAHVAAIELPDHDILESLLINPLTFYWEEGMSLEAAPSRDYQDWGWYMQSLRQPSRWLKLIRGNVDFKSLVTSIFKRVQIKFDSIRGKYFVKRNISDSNSVSTNLIADLKKIEENRIRLTLILARSDPGMDILVTAAGSTVKKMTRQKAMSIYTINNADHTFSMKRSRCDAIDTVTNHLAKRYLD